MIVRPSLARFVLPLGLVACGARGPLDDFTMVGGPGSVDAGGGSSVPTTDASAPPSSGVDASAPGTPVQDDAGILPPGFPPLPGLDSGLVNCGTCVASQCGSSITTCLQDPTCAADLQCVATNCLGGALGGLGGTGGSSGGGGGGTGGNCLSTCGGGGIAGLAPLLPILTCIAGTCGTDCGSLLGGLGGGLGGGGGGGGFGGGGGTGGGTGG